MSLNDTFLRSAKGRAKPWKQADGGGLFILVNPDGHMFWRLSYRFAGKQKTIALGAYPIVGLAVARKLRDAAKEQLARGVDPSEARKLEKLEIARATETSFEAIACEWHEQKKPSLTPVYAAQILTSGLIGSEESQGA